MPSPDFADLCTLAAELGPALERRRLHLATAESCTGGLIAAAVTSAAGSSAWFERGVVTYANTAKTDLLGVDADLFEQVGAVSPEVARAMARGALLSARADLAVAVTGIAGPSGGSEAKPVGTVWFGLATGQGLAASLEARHALFAGDRSAVRLQAARFALLWALEAARNL
ncbi:CinA family protein [Thiomonas intermedia]|uniref:CinA family protein n=1 Tax=Thiomonas intermedia TaxID=926 RepID=UPI0009A55837|nr:nicotinamide-nucleotide amidohydrolase family protein [Thiomonas intermedia]